MYIYPRCEEFHERIAKVYAEVKKQGGGYCFIFDRINQYYLAGTIQDGVFVIRPDGEYAFFVRRSHERAILESPLENIFPMSTYRDLIPFTGKELQRVNLETELATLAMLDRLKKHLNIEEIRPIDRIIGKIRSVKTEYELSMIKESGRQHKYVLESLVPSLLQEGMSETDFFGALYQGMLKAGHHGVTRFSMFQNETMGGQFGFGTNSLYPTAFDGPGGMKGMCHGVPIVGDRERFLKKGDIVFVDIGFGYNGYHTDATQVYIYKGKPTDEMNAVQRECIRVQQQTAKLLKPGVIPSDVYNTVINDVNREILTEFMGFGKRKVRFLGHGIGLQVDDLPILADSYKEPIEENSVIAIEPKNGVNGVGMLGVEDTFIITKESAVCVTGGPREIVTV